MTPNDIEAADLGEDVTHEFERRKGKAGIVVSVRLDPADAEKLIEVAEKEGRTVSYLARQAIRNYLTFATSPSVTVLTVSVSNAQVMDAPLLYSFGGLGIKRSAPDSWQVPAFTKILAS